MRREVQQAILRYLPDKRLDVPDSSALDPILNESEVRKIGFEIKSLSPADLEFVSAGDNPWEIRVYRPTKKDICLQELTKEEMQRIKNAGPKYPFFIEISRRSPYYRLYWNSFSIVNGEFQAVYLEEVDQKELQEFERKIKSLLEKYGLAFISPEELGESISWIDSGDEPEESVTVYDCLFTQDY